MLFAVSAFLCLLILPDPGHAVGNLSYPNAVVPVFDGGNLTVPWSVWAAGALYVGLYLAGIAGRKKRSADDEGEFGFEDIDFGQLDLTDALKEFLAAQSASSTPADYFEPREGFGPITESEVEELDLYDAGQEDFAGQILTVEAARTDLCENRLICEFGNSEAEMRMAVKYLPSKLLRKLEAKWMQSSVMVRLGVTPPGEALCRNLYPCALGGEELLRKYAPNAPPIAIE